MTKRSSIFYIQKKPFFNMTPESLPMLCAYKTSFNILFYNK